MILSLLISCINASSRQKDFEHLVSLMLRGHETYNSRLEVEQHLRCIPKKDRAEFAVLIAMMTTQEPDTNLNEAITQFSEIAPEQRISFTRRVIEFQIITSKAAYRQED